MRALFSCTAAEGHFRPLIPLAQAFADVGHDVVFATAATFGRRVSAAGFDILAAGIDVEELETRYAPFRAKLEKLPPDERRPFAFTWRFATLDAPEKLPALLDCARDWKPDLVVHESADLAAPLVATLLDVPSAQHAFGRLIPTACFERAALETAPLWRAHATTQPPLGGMYRGPYIDICPPSLQTASVPAGVRVEALRPMHPADPGDELPAWVVRLSDRPTVYVTLGTRFNDLPRFRLVVDALADVECNVLATIGSNRDPAELGALPSNTRVERYLSQSLLLSRCALTVAHGGSGSLLAAMAAGLPMVLLPQGADQFENARRCGELGVAEVFMPGEATADGVRAAVIRLLGDPVVRARCDALAQEIEAMPAPGQVVRRLEHIASA